MSVRGFLFGVKKESLVDKLKARKVSKVDLRIRRKRYREAFDVVIRPNGRDDFFGDRLTIYGKPIFRFLPPDSDIVDISNYLNNQGLEVTINDEPLSEVLKNIPTKRMFGTCYPTFYHKK